MNIFKHEFKMNLQSVVTWSIGVAVLIIVFTSVFSSMMQDMALINELFAKYPKELLMAFGLDKIDLSTVLGLFSFVFTFCQVCIAIQASNYGFSLVTVEERDMTADFLLAKPVSRTHVLTAKYLAAIASLTVTDVVIWITSVFFINLYANGRAYDGSALALLLGSIFVFQLVFLTVGAALSLLMKKVKSVTPLSMALAFGMYVLNAFGGMMGDQSIDVITPFKHFDPAYILSHAAFDVPLVMISVAFILISVIGSYLLYTRRNIPTAI